MEPRNIRDIKSCMIENQWNANVSKMHICAKCDSLKYFEIKFPTEREKKPNRKKNCEFIQSNSLCILFNLALSEKTCSCLKNASAQSHWIWDIENIHEKKNEKRLKVNWNWTSDERTITEEERAKERHTLGKSVPFWSLFYVHVHRLTAPAEVLN